MRKKLGIKPPPTPILFPVAARPPRLTHDLLEQALEKAARAGAQTAAPGKVESGGIRKISVREFQEMRGR